MASHDPALVDEDERLENLNIETVLMYEWMVGFDAIGAGVVYLKSQIYSSHILTDKITARWVRMESMDRQGDAV